MTLDNLQYALYLNNRIILDRIKNLKNAIDNIINTDIDELKKLIEDINDTDLANINQLITDLDTDLSNHTNDTVIHVTQDDKDLWNATLQNAKDYAKKLFDSVTSFTIEIVDTLPTENIKSMTIYFIRNGRDNESDYYEEYMYVNDKWEIIGSTFVNLAPYLLKADFEKYQQEIADKFAKYNTSDEIVNILKDYLLTQTFNDTIKNYVTTQTFNDTIKNYTTTEALQKLLEEYAKTEDIHTHENKDIIDKLSESADGNLLFNGQEIKGGSGSDITISEEDNNAIQQKDDGIFVEDKTEQINNIQTQINRVSIAQKTINGVTDYYFIGGTNPTNTYEVNIQSNTSFIYSLKQILSYEDNTGLKISDDGYVTLTEGSWDLTCGTLNNGNNYIKFSWCDRNGNIYGNIGFVPGGSYSNYDLDSNAVITVNPGEILEIAPISKNNITVESFFTFVKIIKISTREIDPVEYINTSQGIEDTPVGHIISHMGNTAPKHYLICDGTEYNISDYPYLAQHFKDEFGSYNYFGGDGNTTFAVPDLRGEFLRGTGTNSHANQGNGATIGKHQDATEIPRILGSYFNHTFSIRMLEGVDYNVIKQPDSNINFTSPTTIYGDMVWNDTTKPLATVRDTTRPTNTSVLYCIKYEPTYYMTVGEYTVQGFEDYSEEEKVIGRWIDGKPLYQKTIIYNKSDFGSAGEHSLLHNIVNVEKIWYDLSQSHVYAIVNNSLEVWTMSNNNSGTAYNFTGVWANTTTLSVYIGNDLFNRTQLYNSIIITVRYTKTTDAENSFTPDMLSTIVMSGNKQEDLTEEELNNLITDTINLLNE